MMMRRPQQAVRPGGFTSRAGSALHRCLPMLDNPRKVSSVEFGRHDPHLSPMLRLGRGHRVGPAGAR